MAPIDAVEIIKLEAKHLAGGLALSTAAGWNQTEADWQLLLKLGNGIGIEDTSGHLIATALTLPQGAEFGWISMVLVDEAHRGQGLATKMLKSCLKTLEDARLVPVLDATKFGKPVYSALGFETQFTYQRWALDKPLSAENLSIFREFSQNAVLEPANEALIVKLDRSVFGGERQGVLQNLMARSTDFSAITEKGDGFVLGREGCRAWQIGPISAATSEDALALLGHAISRIGKPIFIDVCDAATQFVSELESLGFEPQRRFFRMAKLAKKVFGSPQHCFALAGPELG